MAARRHDTPEDGANPDTSDLLRTLLTAVFLSIHERMRGKPKLEEIERIAKAVLAEMQKPEAAAWESAEPLTASRAKRMSFIGRPVCIVGRLTELRDPQLVAIPGQPQEEATCARITDFGGDSIWSLDVLGEKLIGQLQEVRRRGVPVEFLGIVVAVPVDLDAKRPDRSLGQRRDFLLHIVDVRPAGSAFELLAATASERDRAHALLASLRSQQASPMAYLRDRLISGLGIVGVDEFPLLDKLIDFTIMQAVSCGRLGHAPGRLHLLLVGPPGQGKKLVGVAAKLLNPVAADLAAANMSVAGLVGASAHKDGAWVSKPGLVPSASGGVAVIQDAHTLAQGDLRRLGAVLQEVMEDGTATSSVSGGEHREALTAFVIDANRNSQAWSGMETEAAILRLRPVLSRVDAIIEIPKDEERAWKVAARIYETLAARKNALADETWVRDCRLIVAALRDTVPEVGLDAVRDLMVKVHNLIGRTGSIPNSGDFAARLAISFTRLVVASARANGRSVATNNDVEKAIFFLKAKVDFLQTYRPRLSEAPDDDPIDAFLRRHAGRTVTPTEMRKKYEAETGTHVDERTMRRHIQQQQPKRVKKGSYLLPQPK